MSQSLAPLGFKHLHEVNKSETLVLPDLTASLHLLESTMWRRRRAPSSTSKLLMWSFTARTAQPCTASPWSVSPSRPGSTTTFSPSVCRVAVHNLERPAMSAAGARPFQINVGGFKGASWHPIRIYCNYSISVLFLLQLSYEFVGFKQNFSGQMVCN